MQLIFIDETRMEQVCAFLFSCFLFVSPLAVLTKNTVVTRRFIKETQWFINTGVYKGVHSVLVMYEADCFEYSFGLQRWPCGITERDGGGNRTRILVVGSAWTSWYLSFLARRGSRWKQHSAV